MPGGLFCRIENSAAIRLHHHSIDTMTRDARLQSLVAGEPLDAVIIGGGITGAPLYHELARAGYRTAIIDQRDFSSGTSQASGMLIWGGLLYLKNFDLLTVRKLCRARNELFTTFPKEIAPLDIRYHTTPGVGRGPWTMHAGLGLYWLLGGCKLKAPTRSASTLLYQEGMLRESDSRFVIEWLRGLDSEHSLPLNHCRLLHGHFDRAAKLWRLTMRDELTGRTVETKARTVINCGGVWTDQINTLLKLTSPCKHAFSKGVYLALERKGDPREAAVYPMESEDDVLTYVPWGPVMMWGPTETAVHDLEIGRFPDRDDIRFLLQTAQRSLKREIPPSEIVSVRCGIRPLVVDRDDSRSVYPLELSRRHRVITHREQSAISIYGGKLTSSALLAREVANRIRQLITQIAPRYPPLTPQPLIPETTTYSGLCHSFVTPEWARDHEYCVTLDDYLRRRTPISQWVPRMGLGKEGEHRETLRKLTPVFTSTPEQAEQMLSDYEAMVQTRHDSLLQIYY